MLPLPKSDRKSALVLVDIQSGFIKEWKGLLVENLKTLLCHKKYDIYIEVTFHAPKGSIWERQCHWTFPDQHTIAAVEKLLEGVQPVVKIKKETKSAFKGTPNLLRLLKASNIEDVHLVGLDSNDCVFATAQESFDLGFYTYVIEECTGSSGGKKMHEDAINILRYLGLTNHSQ